MWYINGKKYDLTHFKHPGGPIAIELAKDRDGTQLFKSYHPFTNPDLVLKKYEVKEERAKSSIASTDTEEVELFDWSTESEFWNDLKSQVQPLLKRTGTKANLVRWLQLICLTIPIALSFLPFLRGAWWSLLVFPLAVWVLGVNVYHDASHFALSHNWRVNYYACYLWPYFSSPFTWYHQHVIGHHVYTNIRNKDPDMHHGTPLWKIHPGQRFLNHYKYQLYYFWFIWSQMTYSMSFIIDTMFFMKGSYHKVVKMIKVSERRKLIHYAGRVVTFCLVYVWPFFLPHFSWTKSIIWSIVPYSIFGMCFAFSSQFNHLIDETIMKFSKDWYKHQVMTSHTFAPNSLLWFFFTGGLNLQIEHHLFPGVNHWHLREIQPIVESTCKKHNVPYAKSDTFWEAFSKHISHLEKMSKKPQK